MQRAQRDLARDHGAQGGLQHGRTHGRGAPLPDKKRNYYLITVRGDKRVDLKEFRYKYGTRVLSFASENDLMQVLGLIPGAVTPLGLLNDAECKVQLYLDEAFFAAPGLIGVHPNDNTATVWLRADDLAALIQEHGNPVHIAEL